MAPPSKIPPALIAVLGAAAPMSGCILGPCLDYAPTDEPTTATGETGDTGDTGQATRRSALECDPADQVVDAVLDSGVLPEDVAARLRRKAREE